MVAREIPVLKRISTTMSNIPSASEMIDAPSQITVEEVIAAIQTFDSVDLIKVMKAHTAAWEKMMKTVNKVTKTATSKKTGSMPKGVVPPQLRRPRAWVEFVLKHALEHGWETFTIAQSKKDKETGEKVTELIEMAASEMYEEHHVYEGSVSEKNPNGKQMIHKDAMSLSKLYWAPKEQTGSHPELYQEFLNSYEEEDVEMGEAAKAAEPKAVEPKVVRKTVEKEAAKTKEKEAAKAEKEIAKAKKEAEKAEKEANKVKEKMEKEAAKAKEKEEKEAAKAPKKQATPVKAIVKAQVVPSAPIKAKKEEKKEQKKEEKKPVNTWVCEDDGQIHPWDHNGKMYFRNFENQVWLQDEDNNFGAWCGVYLPNENRIDDSVEEPEYEE